jgi:hypothetical protein
MNPFEVKQGVGGVEEIQARSNVVDDEKVGESCNDAWWTSRCAWRPGNDGVCVCGCECDGADGGSKHGLQVGETRAWRQQRGRLLTARSGICEHGGRAGCGCGLGGRGVARLVVHRSLRVSKGLSSHSAVALLTTRLSDGLGGRWASPHTMGV